MITPRTMLMTLSITLLAACTGEILIPGASTGVGGASSSTTTTTATSTDTTTTGAPGTSTTSTGTTSTGTSTGPTLMIYGNYDGGPLTINVDTPVPNIVIGLVSYEAMQVTITGPAAKNVIAVAYAGYNDAPGTKVVGVDPAIVTISKTPSLGSSQPPAPDHVSCVYPGSGTGGCNTPAQIADYFLQTYGGTIGLYDCRYEEYDAPQSTSAGGSCE